MKGFVDLDIVRKQTRYCSTVQPIANSKASGTIKTASLAYIISCNISVWQCGRHMCIEQKTTIQLAHCWAHTQNQNKATGSFVAQVVSCKQPTMDQLLNTADELSTPACTTNSATDWHDSCKVWDTLDQTTLPDAIFQIALLKLDYNM